MSVLRSLLVTLGMNSAQYRADLDKSKKQTKTDYKEMTKASASFAAKSAAAFTSAAVVMATANAKMVRDQSNMASVAQMSLEQYQKMSFAAEQYGVTAEQVADISKDSIEKIGEYINAGTGGLQDFADAMGMTKEETLAWAKSMQGMSGQQIFQQMINEMESVGLSSAQMSNALESLGSDATKLIPLFASNGAELDRLSVKYSEFNGQLSDEQVENYKLAAENIDLLAVSTRNLSAIAIAEMAEGFGDLAKGLADYTRQIRVFGATSATLNVFSGNSLRSVHDDLFKEYQDIQDQLSKYKGVKYEDLPQLNAFGLSKKEWRELKADYEKKRNELKDLNERIVAQQKLESGDFNFEDEIAKKLTKKIELEQDIKPKKTAFESEMDPEKTFGELFVGTDTVDLFELNLSKKNRAMAESMAEQLAMQNETLDEQYDRELQFMQDNLAEYDEFLTAKANLDQKYAKQKEAAEMASMQAVLSATESFSSALLGVMDEQSEGYKAAFLVAQAAAFANAMVASNLAYTQVLAHDAGILGMGAVATAEMVRGLGYASAGLIAGQAVAGVFHGGGAIPENNGEQTYLLKGGEYVESQAERRKIDGMLNGGGGGGMNLTIDLRGTTGDKELDRKLKASAKSAYTMVAMDFRQNGQIAKQARRG